MRKQTRRDFLKAATVASIGMSQVLADDKAPATDTNSKIRVAQIRVYPDKGRLEANHMKLMRVLDDIEREEEVDVLVTPEGFLDGYVVTEKSVTKEDLGRYAIDPERSAYTRAVSDWARRTKTWVIYGCARRATGGVYNTALIYDRDGALVGMYDKTHIQTHDHKYLPGKHLNVYESDFGLFGVMICADRRWPETSRTLTLKGARVIFNPTYGMDAFLRKRNLHSIHTPGTIADHRPEWSRPVQQSGRDSKVHRHRNRPGQGPGEPRRPHSRPPAGYLQLVTNVRCDGSHRFKIQGDTRS